MTQVTANGNSYSDAGETDQDMRNGGFRTWLLAMLSDVMVAINALISGTWTTNVSTVTGTGAQSVGASDHIIVWAPTTPADVTFALPTSPTVGERHVFKYRLTSGQLFGLTVDAGSGKTIDGLAQTYVIRSPLADFAVVYRGSSEWVIDWSYSPASPSPAANLLINPAMEIDQVNEGASVSVVNGAAAYIVDGWTVSRNSATAVTSAQRVADGPGTFSRSLKVTVGTGAAVAAGDFLLINQAIEANELSHLGLGTSSAVKLAVSFWVKSSIAPYTMAVVLRNAAVNRSYPVNITISAANTWEKKTVVIPGDIAGSWVTTGAAAGAFLSFVAAAGSTFQGSNASWAGSNLLGTSSLTNTLLSTNGATFQITAAKLEASPVPTDFQRLMISEEILRCQRHYEKSYNPGVALGTVTVFGQNTTTTYGTTAIFFAGTTVFKATKRVAPTVTIYSPRTGAAGNIGQNGTADVSPAVGDNIGFNAFTLVAGAPFTPTNGGNVEWHWAADARL